MENANIEAAVAQFVNFMTNSAEKAADLAKQGAEVGMTFGSELVEQVLMFNGIKLAVTASILLIVSFLLIRFVVKGAKTVMSVSHVNIDQVISQFDSPNPRTVSHVITASGQAIQVRGIDSDGDAVKIGGGYVYARQIRYALSREQFAAYMRAKEENMGSPSLLLNLHNASAGAGSFFLLLFAALFGAAAALFAIFDIIELIKITVAPYLYLMEYAIELKEKV